MRILRSDLAKALETSSTPKRSISEPALVFPSGFAPFSRARPGYIPSTSCITTELCCKSANRIFDGTRYEQYLERQQTEYERRQEKVRELKGQQQECAERRFHRETISQTLTNPHFVTMNHAHKTANPQSFSFHPLCLTYVGRKSDRT
jgi:hypothetical protein